MSKVPDQYPWRLDWASLAGNGKVPDSRHLNALSNALNFVNAYSRKEVFSDGGMGAFATSVSSSAGLVLHRCFFHTGHAAQALRFAYTISNQIGGAGAPTGPSTVNFSVQKASGGATTTASHVLAPISPIDLSPDILIHGSRAVRVDSDTDYLMTVTGDYGICLRGLAVHELGVSEYNPTVDWFAPGGSTYASIYDANRERLHKGCSGLWKHNGAHLMNWTDMGGTAPTVTGATWTNVCDATTAVSSTSAGYWLGSNLLAPFRRQNENGSTRLPKATLAVYGSVSGGVGTGEVRLLTDSGGSVVLISKTGITTAGWYTTNAQLGGGSIGPNDFTKADLQFRMNGAGTLTLNAVSLFLYET